jgi:hypothetical protein
MWKVTDSRPGLGVPRGPAVGVLDHEVAVDRDGRHPHQRLDDGQPEREVRDEVVVHDVDVGPVGVGDRPQLALEVREVGGEDRR